MEFKDSLRFLREEVLDLLFIILMLAFLFSFSFMIFDGKYPFTKIFLIFFLFLFIVFFLRMILMKVVAYNLGFRFYLYQTYFDRYGFRNYDRFSYNVYKVGKYSLLYHDPKSSEYEGFKKKSSQIVKGIPMSIISLIIYIFSLGLIIFPALWRYKYEIVNHTFIGKIYDFEVDYNWLNPAQVTGFRISRALLFGNLFYLVFAIFLKYLIFDTWFFLWFLFIIFWIAILNLLPIPGTEGYDLYNFSKFAWYTSLVILVSGLGAILLFDSIVYIMIFVIVCFLAVFLVGTNAGVIWEK